MYPAYPIQIFYEDTDAGGIVYHANYVKFMERARTVLFQQKGLTLKALYTQYAVQFVVRSLHLEYERPVRLEDTIWVVTTVAKLGKASVTLSQNMYFDPQDSKTCVCKGEVVLVCINDNLKPQPIPAIVVELLGGPTHEH